MHASTKRERGRRGPGSIAALLVLGVVPCICALVVHDLIFHVYGNGHFIPIDSPGIGVLDFWSDQGGMYMVPAGIAFLTVLARGCKLAVALGFAALAALSTLAILVLGVLWAVIVDGASLS